MPTETKISTPLPAGVSQQAVIAALHDHDNYIRTTCPQLISYKHVSGSPGGGAPCVYEVVDKRPIGQTTYRLTLSDHAEGIDATVEGKAPTGSLTIKSFWRVRETAVEEEVQIESNMLMTKMIKSNVDKSHPGFQENFLSQAAKA
ncbi:hypothetical protein GGR56DRAFT_677678 [Xylariaceae sp. FL0804]|nr:hypothetical protein GGR56DRAFT_677678 [Xylariaceae sp. FL0804]